MSKLLDGQDKMIEKLATVSEIVRRHDEVTFPNITDQLTRMESKQNKDITLFTKKEEELREQMKDHKSDTDTRLKLVEADLKKRLDNTKDTKSHIKGILWGGIEKIVYVIIGGTVVYWNIVKTKLDL